MQFTKRIVEDDTCNLADPVKFEMETLVAGEIAWLADLPAAEQRSGHKVLMRESEDRVDTPRPP